jgi:hypothetical protein
LGDSLQFLDALVDNAGQAITGSTGPAQPRFFGTGRIGMEALDLRSTWYVEEVAELLELISRRLEQLSGVLS